MRRIALALTVLLGACVSPSAPLRECRLEISQIEVVGLGEFWILTDTTEVCE